jgi:hypothetical protein
MMTTSDSAEPAVSPSGGIRGVGISGAAILWSMLLVVFFVCRPCSAAPVPVLYSEGMVRGFLELKDTKGTRIASGDFLQVLHDSEVKTRVLLHFKDGSVHDETAIFTQDRHFILQKYHLIQQGPAFADDMDASLERSSGKYLVKVKPRKEGKEKVLEGKVDLPHDVYNGMVPTVAKNLKGKGATVHIVAFTPTPRVIELELTPSGEDRFFVGELKRSAVHYVVKAKLGLLKIVASLTGQTPPDNHLWILTSDIPAFVRFDGPLATGGPIWSIELTSPVWPKK